MPVSANSDNSSLSSWLNERLTALLGFPTEEIAQYILSMESASEREQYLTEMLDVAGDADHRRFVQEFLQRSQSGGRPQVPEGVTLYQKKRAEEEEVLQAKNKGKNKTPDKLPASSPAGSKSSSSSSGGKTKYIPLYSSHGAAKDVVTLKGRHPCQCQAAKHPLVNNCTSCGKIVCQQEGSGPCLFCGDLVCTKEELEVLNRNSRKSEQLLKKLLGPKEEDKKGDAKGGDRSEALNKAEMHKNRLLEFDRSCEKRTQVIDDESDYFSVDGNRWLTKNQREALKKREEELREKRHGSRLNRTITFDFAGRRVVEEGAPLADYDPAKDEEVKRIMADDGRRKDDSVGGWSEGGRRVLEEGTVANPFVDVRPQLVESSKSTDAVAKTGGQLESSKKFGRRLQDRELQEMSDNGLCLSMHQPYASLLVCGIKRDEGRTWYSAHRGRLWIHAAAKVPTDEEVKEVKNFYKDFYGDDKLPFPSLFPTGCLLGCVEVVDCMSQEDYREVYPDGESLSNYVFVCANPKALMIKFPMQGQHKIYKLDPNIHSAVKKATKKAFSE